MVARGWFPSYPIEFPWIPPWLVHKFIPLGNGTHLLQLFFAHLRHLHLLHQLKSVAWLLGLMNFPEHRGYRLAIWLAATLKCATWSFEPRDFDVFWEFQVLREARSPWVWPFLAMWNWQNLRILDGFNGLSASLFPSFCGVCSARPYPKIHWPPDIPHAHPRRSSICRLMLASPQKNWTEQVNLHVRLLKTQGSRWFSLIFIRFRIF